MAKVKIPKSKINDIKKKFSESKIEALLEESGEDLKENLSLEDAKQIAREQKVNEAIRERVAQLGIKIEDTDDKATLLEKEKVYNEEREKI